MEARTAFITNLKAPYLTPFIDVYEAVGGLSIKVTNECLPHGLK